MRSLIAALSVFIGFLGDRALCQAPKDCDMQVVLDRTEIHGKPTAVVSERLNGSVLLTTRLDGVQGWSLGIIVDSDPGISARITSIALGSGSRTVRAGGLPDFVSAEWYAEGDLRNSAGSCCAGREEFCREEECEGIEDISAVAVTHSVVIDVVQAVTLPRTLGFEMLEFTLHVQGAIDAGQARIAFTSEVGSPPRATVAVHGGRSFVPAVQEGATISLVPTTEAATFRRGDCNDDGTVDISDAVFSLGSLFLGEGNPGCDDACDSNDVVR